MPSPVAHCSLAIAAWPPLRRRLHAVARWRRNLFLLALLAALVAPDLDILLDPLMGRPWFENHGGPVHSLAAGVLFGVPFALACRILVPLPLLTLWTVGALAFWSHVLLDACTYGRGVALLWPVMNDRIGLPVPLFFGVRHDAWNTWGLHAITIVSELAFAGAVWAAARFARARTRRATQARATRAVFSVEGA